MCNCERFVCICEALNLCAKLPGCTCAGLAAAECALVMADKQLQTQAWATSIDEGRRRESARCILTPAAKRRGGKVGVHSIVLGLVTIANVGAVR